MQFYIFVLFDYFLSQLSRKNFHYFFPISDTKTVIRNVLNDSHSSSHFFSMQVKNMNSTIKLDDSKINYSVDTTFD